ncbi:class I SAM-dependent methyltransferase (plasmid) [Pantoea piersonii]|uniref:Class I SAM-dependent methyltransferase n=1 Tax=Pantoea piersonii TaxID=2364647 RepID=A0AAJ5QNA3_9GAMM|nr:class I SAM-dependent methyltransferase [Pantoea piersonii]WBG93146.1 class I SAM-dependent methyltransferase [Pantoea piersonii]
MSDQAFKAVISLYEKHASAFAKMRPASLAEKAWLDRFLSSLPPGGHILDLGCGNGSPIAAYFLSQGFKVTGVDSSPSMISQCRDKFPHETWLVSDMREVNLGMNFDGILAWDSFFHLCHADQRKIFALFSAHAKEGAALMFNAGPEEGEAIGEFQGEPLAHASLSALEYESLMHNYGFQLIGHVVEDKQCNGRTIWLATKSVN